MVEVNLGALKLNKLQNIINVKIRYEKEIKTMKLIEKAKRTIRTQDYFNNLKILGANIVNKDEYKKWKQLSDGKMSVTLTVYKVNFQSVQDGFFVISDTLGKVAFNDRIEEKEIIKWLEEKGYKTEKEFHLENGMSEELYDEWCK